MPQVGEGRRTNEFTHPSPLPSYQRVQSTLHYTAILSCSVGDIKRMTRWCIAIGIQHNNRTTGTLSFGVLLLDTTGVVEHAVIRIEDIDGK